jgi:hypothetical protein
MTNDELKRRLLSETIVTLSPAEWAEVEGAFEEVERHGTLIAGDLIIARDGGGLVAVEEPSPRERVVRRLADDAAVRAFVKDRLDTYERMWDGCGCKVEYYG